MSFKDQLKEFSKRVETIKDSISTEEATKTALIMPFFAMLGYDVFNPAEFIPEYITDVGIKKGEKVDYAIMFEGIPTIIVEAKSVNENLSKHGSQLFRYFCVSKAKFAILTNGVTYQFYTDLDETNKMDDAPFLEINMLDIKEHQIPELKKYTKSNFNIDEIFSVASDLKYSNKFKNIFAEELNNPSDEFVKFFLTKAYDGRQTQQTIDKFKEVLKKSLNSYVAELMSDKIKTALGTTDNFDNVQMISNVLNEEPFLKDIKGGVKIVTTPEELEGFFIVKSLFEGIVPLEQITYKDTESYMGILYKGKVTNWICRLHFNSSNKYITIPDENKKPIRIDIEDIYDIKNSANEIVNVLVNYLA